MIPLQAEIWTNARTREGRRAPRRTLRLEVPAVTAADATKALIHDLSETGLLIETTATLKVGETLQVELPVRGNVDARIVWTRASYFGCEFTSPVSKAAVSAALLVSPVEVSAEPAPSGIVSTPAPVEHDYPAEVATNPIALGLSLVLLLAVVILFLIAVVRFAAVT